MTHEDNVKRVQVTFTEEQWSLIRHLKGIMGQTDAEIIRNIVLSWLTEKSIISSLIKKKIGDSK